VESKRWVVSRKNGRERRTRWGGRETRNERETNSMTVVRVKVSHVLEAALQSITKSNKLAVSLSDENKKNSERRGEVVFADSHHKRTNPPSLPPPLLPTLPPTNPTSSRELSAWFY